MEDFLQSKISHFIRNDETLRFESFSRDHDRCLRRDIVRIECLQ